VRLLLDTHVLLWWLADDAALEAAGRALIADPDNLVHVSAASVWEAEIKAGLGRLELASDVILADHVAGEGFTEVAITAVHGSAAARLPAHHADPFDRMLVAQARTERLTLVTGDAAILSGYDVDTISV